MDAPRHCVVTGVAGFIGSALARELLRAGHHVTGIDCVDDYYDRALKRARIEAVRGVEGGGGDFEFREVNLLDPALASALEGAEYVFHLAGRPGVRASWGERFEDFVRDNVLATQRLLETLKRSDIRRFVYSSSSSVYGNAEAYPTSEALRPQPISPYGVTKLAAEHLCTLYAREQAVPTVSLRYFTVYGPGQRPDMAFNRFIAAASAGRAIEIHGDGRQTRDFTFVDDIVRANLLAADHEGAGDVFNIGGGARTALLDVIPILERAMERPIALEFLPKSAGDARDTAADITRAREALGYEPRVSLEDGLTAQVWWQLGRAEGHRGAEGASV